MATILTKAIISGAMQEVDSYIGTANGLYQELQGVINTLTTSNFNGDASEGYKVFFDTKVTPALTENLTAPNSSLTAGIKSILETIQSQLLDTVDPQLGSTNRNPGGQPATDSKPDFVDAIKIDEIRKDYVLYNATK